MTPEQAAEIFRLREAKVAPKQIARKLGLRPAEVNTFIRDHAEEVYLKAAREGTLNPLHEGLINQSAAERLLEGKKLSDGEGVAGMAQVILARQDRNRYLVGSYLVDYWCLGVKDAIPPRKMGSSEYQMFKDACVRQFNEPFVSITLEQLQSIVLGAVDYACSLGFEPGKDFNVKAQTHLGQPPETLMPIEFGKDGQPFFMSGPYDDVEKVLRTLEASVGPDNFHFLAGLGPAGMDDLLLPE